MCFAWLRGANLFVGMRSDSLQRKYADFGSFVEVALPFAKSAYDDGNKCKMVIFSNDEIVVNLYSVYQTTAALMRDIGKIGKLLMKDVDEINGTKVCRFAFSRHGCGGMAFSTYPRVFSADVCILLRVYI